MITNIYTIFDKAVSAYMRPFFLQSDGQAMRAFKDMACDAEHDIGRHPEDYSLFRIGSFDDGTAKIDLQEPLVLARAHEVVALDRQTFINGNSEDKVDA